MKKYEAHEFPKRQAKEKTKVEVFYKKYQIPFVNNIYERITEFEVEETSIPKILEKVYREMNIVHGKENERAYRLKVRSMSVGDLVKIRGRTFRVDNVGWSEIKRVKQP